ncbi:MAG: ABC transporter permease, partial [Planctomycetes bacterium]|nr:ABC transporter permease [Planctomycetota bacterium]
MRKLSRALALENSALYITLVAVFLLMAVLNGEKFFSAQNLGSMAYQLPVIGLLSVGMMIAMLTGGINLSIIANANLNGILVWLVLEAFMGREHMAEAGVGVIILAVIAGFVGSVVVGFVNGFLISIFEIPAILVTLGTMTLGGGLN